MREFGQPVALQFVDTLAASGRSAVAQMLCSLAICEIKKMHIIDRPGAVASQMKCTTELGWSPWACKKVWERSHFATMGAQQGSTEPLSSGGCPLWAHGQQGAWPRCTPKFSTDVQNGQGQLPAVIQQAVAKGSAPQGSQTAVTTGWAGCPGYVKKMMGALRFYNHGRPGRCHKPGSTTAMVLLLKQAATRVPCRFQQTSKMPPAPLKVRTRAPPGTDQMWSCLSKLPLASQRPSGLKATEYTGCVCCMRVLTQVPVSISHNLHIPHTRFDPREPMPFPEQSPNQALLRVVMRVFNGRSEAKMDFSDLFAKEGSAKCFSGNARLHDVKFQNRLQVTSLRMNLS